MSIGKREVTLLIVLGVLLYAFLFYTLILQNFIPDFKEVNSKLAEAQQKENMLKDDLKNIDKLRLQYNSRSIQNERMEGYLLSSADITACIEYLDKLAKAVGKQFTDITLYEPQEKNTGPKTETKVEDDSEDDLGTGKKTETSEAAEPSPKPATRSEKYYELAMSFKASLSYDDLSNLLNYIEGGSRRIKVSKFKVEAPKAAATGANGGAKPVSDNKSYDINMELNIYSQNVGNLDKLYDYGSNSFSSYIKGNGLQFEGMPQISIAVPSTPPTTTSTAPDKGPSASPISSSADIVIIETGYLTAGNNLEIYGINRAEDIIRLKTNGRTDVSLVLSKSTFTITSPNNVGKTSTISGRLPDGDLNIDMTVNIPNIKENEKMRLNFKVTNNSSKKINIKFSDNSGRARILERNGTQITGESKRENLSII